LLEQLLIFVAHYGTATSGYYAVVRAQQLAECTGFPVTKSLLTFDVEDASNINPGAFLDKVIAVLELTV